MSVKWTQLGSDIDGEAMYDYSGTAVSLSSDGTRVAIGDYYGNGMYSGRVRVFEYESSGWKQLGSDIDGEASYDNSGVGTAVSLSWDGTRVAIGAYGNDGNGMFSGHVRVFEYESSEWKQLGSDIDGEASYDNSGSAVSLSSDGTRVAIGAYGNDDNGRNSGHVRVFEFESSEWKQLGSDIDGEASYDNSGSAVSLSSDGTRVAIGARENNGDIYSAGHVRVFEFECTNSEWKQLGSDIDGEAIYDHSGTAVSLSSDGTRVAISADGNDDNGPNSGHVRVFEYKNSEWKQLGSDIDGEASYDISGIAVSLSSCGTRVAIGASGNDGDNGPNSGHVRVFEYKNSEWKQVGSDIDGEAGWDYSGSAVSLSPDGTRVAMGAQLNSGNGLFSGHVRVFECASLEKQLCGSSTGDPYVYPMLSKIPVKLPDKEACYRLYQDGSTFVNAEVIRATPEHQERMNKFAKEFFPDINRVVMDGFFYSKFFIVTDGDTFLFDLKTKQCRIGSQDKNEKFNIKTTRGTIGYELGNPLARGMADQHEISWTTEEGKMFCVTISFYDNPHVENGISITVDRVSKKALGLCVKNYRPKLMVIPNVLTQNYDKLQRRITKSNSPFQQKLIKSKNEKWHEKTVKVNK